jgi:hypothetical protein
MAFKRGEETFNQFINERNSVMDKQYPYNNIIENKLQHLPGADVEQLWAGMHGILDKKMPQKKERPLLFGWFLTSKSLLLVGAISALVLCYFAFTHFSSKPVAKPEPSVAISNNTTPATTKENTTASESEENLVNNENSATPVYNEREQATGVGSAPAILTGNNDKSGYNTSVVPIDEHNSANNNNLTQKENRPNSKTYAKAWNKKSNLFITNEDENVRNLTAENTNSGSAASLATASIELTRQYRSATHFSIGDTTIPTHRNGLRDLLLQEVKAGKKIRLNKIDKGPYVGIMAGLDLSSVRFGSMKTGNNKGIIAGYAFNKRWSVETGLFWNKKRFLGNGSDFHPAGYVLPQGVEMLSVYGNNQLYEWPVNVRFTILPKKHSLFVSAGLSSYYMKTESYEYEYMYNGQPGKSFSSYKNQTKDWLSVANIGLGYAHKLGGIGTIRVEPYLKIPIRDIGINNMAVFSTGLNVGFTRQILK